MQRSNLAGAIFLGLFGLPFTGMGLAFAFTAARSGTNMPGLIRVLFGAFFACIGFGLMTAAVVGYKKANQQSALEEATPDKPWLWREDWASGRANGGDPKANITMWVFTAFWDFISIAATVAVFPKLVNGGDLRALLVFLFPVAGIFITAMAVRGTIRIQRFGPTSFWFDTFPFSPGVRVKGVIHLKLPTAAPHGIDLRLSCIRRVTTSSGKNRSVTELILWQDTRNVPAEHIIQGLSDAQVPVDFAIPADAYETDSNNSNDRLIWQLHAEADVPGVDFSDDYEIPVFRTQASAAAAGEASSSSAAFSSTGSMSSAPQPEAPAPPPSHTHIVFSENEQGTSFYFPPLRSIPQALGIFVFATIWTGVVYFLWTHPQVPWIFRIVFSLFEILVIYMFLSVVFGSALLRVQNGVLQVRTAILGFGTLRTLPFSDVASISPLSQGRANTSGEVLYGINVKQSDGRNINVAGTVAVHDEELVTPLGAVIRDSSAVRLSSPTASGSRGAPLLASSSFRRASRTRRARSRSSPPTVAPAGSRSCAPSHAPRASGSRSFSPSGSSSSFVLTKSAISSAPAGMGISSSFIPLPSLVPLLPNVVDR